MRKYYANYLQCYLLFPSLRKINADMKGTYTYEYPRPALTADCVIFGFDSEGLSVLLIERGIEPFKGCWAFPGGFMQMDEDAEACARRELEEETGLKGVHAEQFGTFSEVNRDPRGRTVTVAHMALVKKAEVKGADDAAQAKWFPIDSIPPLAFDHDRILRVALKALREKIHFEPVGFELLPEVFTMPQLQDLYESVLQVKFDRRNFANKMLKLGILTEVNDGTIRKGTRTPIKYSFNQESYNQMKAKGFRLEF